MREADVALVGGDAADVIGILLHQIAVEVNELLPHLGGVFLIDAEHQRLGEAIGAFEQIGQVAGHGPGAGTQCNDALEVLGLVFVVGHLAAKAVELVLAGPPARCVHGGDDAVHAVGCKKAVLYALTQAVGIDGVAEVFVAVARFFAQRGGRHAELHGGREIVEHRAPRAFIAAGAAMALVDDDEVEKIRAVLAEHVGGGGRKRLIDAEIHVPALAGVAATDLVPGIAEGREHLGHGVIDQDVAIREEQDFGAAVFTRAVPFAVPQLPANLEGHIGLARAGGQRGEDAFLPQQDGLNHALDGDALVVTRHLAGDQIERLQQVLGSLMRQLCGAGQAGEQFLRRGIAFHLALGAGGVVDLNDAVAVGGVGELETEDFGVLACLLNTGFSGQTNLLGFNHGQRVVAAVVQQVVGTFLLTAPHLAARDDDATVGEAALLADGTGRIAPARLDQSWRDEFAASVCFGHYAVSHRHPPLSRSKF